LNCRGALRIEIDFRPRFFVVREEESLLNNNMTPQEEDEYYAVRPIDESPEALMFAAEMQPSLEEDGAAQGLTFEQYVALMSGARQRGDAERMYRRFIQISVWARKVMSVRSQLEAAEGETEEMHRRTERENLLLTYTRKVQKRIKDARDARQNRKLLLDRPMGATVAAPEAMTRSAAVQPGGAARAGQPGMSHAKVKMKLPKLQAEPWLEELMETSRLL
jgi:hypothetical protein